MLLTVRAGKISNGRGAMAGKSASPGLAGPAGRGREPEPGPRPGPGRGPGPGPRQGPGHQDYVFIISFPQRAYAYPYSDML